MAKMEVYKSKAAMAKHEKGESAKKADKEDKSGMKDVVRKAPKKKGK